MIGETKGELFICEGSPGVWMGLVGEKQTEVFERILRYRFIVHSTVSMLLPVRIEGSAAGDGRSLLRGVDV